MVIVCTKFDRNRTTPGWVIQNFSNFCSIYVSLWPWPLTPWPWTFVVVRASCVQTLCKIWAKSNNPLQSYWRFSYLFPRGGISKLYSSEGGGPNSTKFGVNRAPSLMHSLRNFGSDMLFRFEMTAAQKWAMSSDVEIAAKFHTFWPPVKIRGGVGEISGLRFLALSRTEPRVYIWRASSARLLRIVGC